MEIHSKYLETKLDLQISMLLNGMNKVVSMLKMFLTVFLMERQFILTLTKDLVEIHMADSSQLFMLFMIL